MRTETRRHQPSSPWTYPLLDQRQREIAENVRAGSPGCILLNEVAPVITYGRRTPPTDLLLSHEELSFNGIEVLETDRGGLATYHGPGQWVLFVVESLERLTGDPRGVRKAVDLLLSIALAVGRQYDPKAEIREGAELGVWGEKGKFAAVGVQVEQGVLLHGLSFNGYKTPTSFLGLRPCGLEAQVGYLLDSTGVGPGEKEKGFVDLGEKLKETAQSLVD